MRVLRFPTPDLWDVFVSYAAEDKAEVARPLATELRRRGLRVWFDDFELHVGDDLRTEIDRGLSSSHHGIVILSPSFFGKQWTADELGALHAREMSGRRRVILPVWRGLSSAAMAQHSPLLAGRKAARAEQPVAKLADELIAAMDESVRTRAGYRRGLSLSPPPSSVELSIVPAGSRLLELLANHHELVLEVDGIEDVGLRERVGNIVDELRLLSDELAADESPSTASRTRAQQLMVELLSHELLVLVGEYERQLTDDATATLWRGVVVRVAPAAVIAERQSLAEPAATSMSRRDQKQLDQLLGLITRHAVRQLSEHDFVAPWPDRITTPFAFLVNDFDDVEHEFADPALERWRQRLLQASNHFLFQEAMNGFDSYVPQRRDCGWTPGQAEGDADAEALIDRRSAILRAAAEDVSSVYDELVKVARDAGYDLSAMTAIDHLRVQEHNRRLGI